MERQVSDSHSTTMHVKPLKKTDYPDAFSCALLKGRTRFWTVYLVLSSFFVKKLIGYDGLNIFRNLTPSALSRLGGSMRFFFLIIVDLSLGFLLCKALFFFYSKNWKLEISFRLELGRSGLDIIK
jgi:hypothetical protein